MGCDIRHILKPVRLVVVGDAGEFPRAEPSSPTMRTGDPLDADLLRDQVERRPQAHILRAIDAIIGLIVMPRSYLARPWLLDEDMLVKEARSARSHQLARDPRGRAIEDEVAVLRNARPIAVVANEPPSTALWCVDALIETRFLEVSLDAPAQRLDPVAEHAFKEDGTIGAKRFDQLLRDRH